MEERRYLLRLTPLVQLISKKKLQALSAVEIIISIAVLAFVIIAVAGTIVGATSGPALTAQQTKAYELLDEGFTAVKSIRDEDFANLLAGTHGLSASSNQWQLAGTSDSTDGFIRTLDIVNIDANTKEVTITISWTPEIGSPDVISSSQIITNYRRTVAITPPPPDTPVDWSTPQVVGQGDINSGSDGRDVRLDGDYAYTITTNSNNDFTVFDISDITNPTAISTLNVANSATRMDYANGTVYITASDNSAEVTIVDASNPNNPSELATINLPRNSNANGILIDGSTLYVTRTRATNSGADELTVVDVSNPSSPNVIGGADINENIYDITLFGNYAYLTSDDDNSEVYIVDVSTPSNPSVVGNIDLSGNNDAHAVGVTDSYLFVSRRDGSVHILDLTNPLSPQELAVYAAAGRVERIMFDETYTFAFFPNSTNYNMDFEVVDISTITAPIQIDHLNNDGVQYSMDYDASRNLIALITNADYELLLVSDQVTLPPGEDLCTVNYNIGSQWGSGFTVNVVINNISSSNISSWQIAWSFDGDQNITNFWNVDLSQVGQDVVGDNLSYNSSIPAGGNQSFGFQATYSGSNSAIPSDQFTVNGIQCVN